MIDSRERVLLVDEHDKQIGTMPKMEAHEKGLLHRAFSVFLFNPKGEMLIHKRALTKYHSPGLWTNACCSHPREGESTEAAAIRRISEELGITAEITPVFSFIYKAQFDNGLTEHELDHVFIGTTDQQLSPDSSEVAEFKYIPLDILLRDVEETPERYTVWFRIALKQLVENQILD